VEVELFDGTVLEFPDGTADDVIDKVARRETLRAKTTARKTANPSEYDPSSKAYKAKYGAASGGGFENFKAGAGKAFYDIGRGALQLAGQDNQQAVDESRARDADLMATGAGRGGNLFGNVAIAAPAAFVPGANTYLGSAALGGALGAVQPVASDESRAENVAFGAAGGAAGKFLGDKLARGVSNALENPVAANAPMRETGRKLGFKLTPGQATGNKSLQRLEAALESKSFTSSPFDRIKDANQKNFNRIALEAIGAKGDKLSGEVLDAADQRIGAAFQDAADDVARKIDPDQFLDKVAEIEDGLEGLVPGFSDNPLVGQLIDLAGKGQASGKQLHSLASKLGKAAYKQMSSPNGDRDLGMALYQVKDYTDDLLQEGMDAGRKEGFKQARSQYRALMQLTSRVGNIKAGNVKGGSLANTLQTKDKKGFLYGRNQSDLYNASRWAQEYAPIVGDSGTATRSQGLTDFLVGLPTNVVSRLYANPAVTNAALGGQRALQAGFRGAAPLSPFAERGLPPALALALMQANQE
jgi:hypothetical protein